MKRLVVVVRDRASDTFGAPFLVVARGQGIRSFSDEINRSASDNALFCHPEDFDLYELGVFDDSSGLFTTGVPEMIAVGKDLRVVESLKEVRRVS